VARDVIDSDSRASFVHHIETVLVSKLIVGLAAQEFEVKVEVAVVVDSFPIVARITHNPNVSWPQCGIVVQVQQKVMLFLRLQRWHLHVMLLTDSGSILE